MKVNLFNQYFVNIGRYIAENLPNIPKKTDIQHFYQSLQHLPATLRFWNLKKIFKSPLKIKSNKAAGPDGISCYFSNRPCNQ